MIEKVLAEFYTHLNPIVVNTSIDSAIDGNEDPVENLSSTTSNDINFTFSGQITPEDTEVDSQWVSM